MPTLSFKMDMNAAKFFKQYFYTNQTCLNMPFDHESDYERLIIRSD